MEYSSNSPPFLLLWHLPFVAEEFLTLDPLLLDLLFICHVSNSSIKESHQLKFHRCPFCQKVFIKHKKNFNAHVTRCLANPPSTHPSSRRSFKVLSQTNMHACGTTDLHKPRSSHAVASHTQMSTSRKMFSGTHEDGYPMVKSRFLHISPKKMEMTRRSVPSLPSHPDIAVDATLDRPKVVYLLTPSIMNPRPRIHPMHPILSPTK